MICEFLALTSWSCRWTHTRRSPDTHEVTHVVCNTHVSHCARLRLTELSVLRSARHSPLPLPPPPPLWCLFSHGDSESAQGTSSRDVSSAEPECNVTRVMSRLPSRHLSLRHIPWPRAHFIRPWRVARVLTKAGRSVFGLESDRLRLKTPAPAPSERAGRVRHDQ